METGYRCPAALPQSSVPSDVALHVKLLVIFGHHANHAAFLVDILDGAQRTVNPTLLLIVLDKDNLCAWFQVQLHRGGQRALGEVAFDFALKHTHFAIQRIQLLVVDEINRIPAGSEGYC